MSLIFLLVFIYLVFLIFKILTKKEKRFQNDIRFTPTENEIPKILVKIIPFLNLLLIIFLPFLIINFTDFPYLGFSLAGIITTFYTFSLIKKKNLYTYIFTISSLFFSLTFLFRTNELLTFFNLVFLIYSLCFVVFESNLKVFQNQGKYTIGYYLVAPLILLSLVISTKNHFHFHFFPKLKNQKILTEILLGSIFTIFILIIILPLLGSSNPIFSNYLQSFFNLIFNFTYIPHIILSIFLGFLVPRFATLLNINNNQISSKPQTESKRNIFSLPKIIVSAILLLFLISQVEIYLASKEKLANLGINYGNLNNDVFAQLSIVCLIVFGLIYIDRIMKKLNLSVSKILLIQTTFLAFVAGKSVFDYMLNWGFTFKRLYGLAVVIFILAVIAVLAVKLYKNFSDYTFFRIISFYLILILGLINIINFDRLIFNNLPRETNGIKYSYYVELSSDAGNLDQILNKLNQLQKTNCRYSGNLTQKLAEAKNLQNKYNTLTTKITKENWNTFNFSSFWNYQTIKNLDLEKLNLNRCR
jgi:hypothetical protein